MLHISQSLGAPPAPTPEAQAHSARLSERIRAEIAAASGWLDFERYMELALYAPGLGYYSAGAHKFGAAGDFITAPEISPLFSRCLARQCAEVLTELGEGDILELGAGSGVMAADMLAELARLEALPRRYAILEVSAELRARQQELLTERVPRWLSRVAWLERLPETFTGVLLGNEVLDALPVRRFHRTETAFEEWGVSAGTDGGLRAERRAATAELAAALDVLQATLPAPLPEGYDSEICLRLPGLIASLAALIARGVLLFLDYGYARTAYYHPERAMGTLMCHYRHRAHDDPFRFVGLQDITAHVDFTAVAEAGVAAGLTPAGYTTQAQFLLALDIASDVHDPDEARQVKRLTHPAEMGESFKAIALSRGLARPLRGFALRDLSHTL